MGVSASPLEFAAKMLAAGEAVEHAAKVGTEAGALLVKRTILARTPDRLRGVGKRGAKLGVRYTVGDYPDGAKALVYAVGPFQLIERDTKAHDIRARRGGKRGTGKLKIGVIPGVGPRSVIHHPGTKGKHPFEHGVNEALPLIPKAYDAAVIAHLAAIF